MDDETLILSEFVRQSPNRLKILKALGNRKLRPSDIAKETTIHLNNVSRSLRKMKEHNIVYLLNPEAKRGRWYKLTENGKKVLKNLNEE